MDFRSDNVSGCWDEIIESLRGGMLCGTTSAAYTMENAECFRMTNILRDTFEHDSLVCFPVCTGTAANALGLSQMAGLCGPCVSVIATDQGHIGTDEAGAFGYLSDGGIIQSVYCENGKLTPAKLKNEVMKVPGSIHRSQPKIVYLTQSTEVGTVYTLEELNAVTKQARELGLLVFLDGARLANAIDHLHCKPADTTWKAGVDVMSLGLTKSGAILAEVLIFFKPQLSIQLESRLKRSGHLVSKNRFISIQVSTMIQKNLWLKAASHSNGLSQKLYKYLSKNNIKTVFPVEANEIYIHLSREQADILKHKHNILFYEYPPAGFNNPPLAIEKTSSSSEETTIIRIVMAFDTNSEVVDRLFRSFPTIV